MKLIYIAGPYRAKTAWQIQCNIHEARCWGAAVVPLGAMPVVPHANTAHFDGLAVDEFWIMGTLEIMSRCDAVLMVPGWQKSEGACGEREQAMLQGLPVFHNTVELGSWIDQLGG